MSDYNNDGDADSLFGSPPPSPPPSRGTSAPSLALPGSSAASNTLPKNVGTIALPGSHNSSEHVVSLPASPPRQRATPAPLAPRSQRGAPLEVDPSGGRAVSLVTPRKKAKPAKRKAKSIPPGPAPVPSGPAFSLPDLSSPLPPNFLRNQQALLGLAGVVGGINPAQLSTRSSRGTSLQNPIVVEEEAPSISSSAWKARQQQLPTQMPPPSGQAVADTLISQGNIFPVLRSLLPYFGTTANVGCCSGHAVHQYQAHNASAAHPDLAAPPLKRRRLNSVPAGAKDWDVPYPFPSDEGPKHYLQDWERERGKRLMMQLVTLVRDAVQKAAVKSYVQEKAKEKKKSSESPPAEDHLRHYRPSVLNYGRDDLPVDGTFYDTSSFVQGSSNSPTSSTTSAQETMCPDFLASDEHGTGLSAQSFESDLETLLGAVNDALSSNNIHLTGDDLAAMSTFGFSPTASNSPTLTSSTRLPTPCDLTRPSSADCNKENAFTDSIFSQSQIFNFGLDDIPIDPALFDFSYTPTVATDSTSERTSYPPSIPESFVGVESAIDNEQAPTLGRLEINIPTPVNSIMHTPSPPLDRTTSQSAVTPVQSETTQMQTQVFRLQAPSQNVRFLPPITDMAARPRSGPSRSTSKRLDREDVLRRGKVRREQLAAEIARAKVELWETTIEQGVLINLSKDKELLSK